MNEIAVYKIENVNAILFPEKKSEHIEIVISADFSYISDKINDHFRSDFFAILLVIKGEVTVNINFKEYHATKNTLIVIAPNDIRQFTDNNATAIFSVVAFSAKYFKTIEHARHRLDFPNYFTSQFSPIWKLNFQDGKMINRLLRELYKRNCKVKNHIFGDELLKIAFNILMYETMALGSKYSKLVNTYLSRKEEVVLEFTKLVQKNFRLERAVKFYASELNISSKYLTEIVKEFLGISSREVIDFYVVEEAILLMLNNKLSIAQIADELNFSDQSFFGKFFKRFTSISPKEYRKSLLSIRS